MAANGSNGSDRMGYFHQWFLGNTRDPQLNIDFNPGYASDLASRQQSDNKTGLSSRIKLSRETELPTDRQWSSHLHLFLLDERPDFCKIIELDIVLQPDLQGTDGTSISWCSRSILISPICLTLIRNLKSALFCSTSLSIYTKTPHQITYIPIKYSILQLYFLVLINFGVVVWISVFFNRKTKCTTHICIVFVTMFFV